MVTTIEKPQILSLEAFLALPETQPASKYANGVITPKAMPKGKHSIIQFELASTINQPTNKTLKICLCPTRITLHLCRTFHCR